MADYIYRIQPTRVAMLTDGPTQEESEATMDHFSYIKRGIDHGKVLLAGRTNTRDDTTFGIVIFRADSEEDARKFVDEDPAVLANVMRAELFPFRLALLAEHWER